MVRKGHRYGVAQFLWFFLSVAAMVLVASGKSEPYVSLSDLPPAFSRSPEVYLFGSTVAVILVGVAVIQAFETRAWKRAGRGANLAVEGGGIFGKPEMVGTVRGRRVRVKTIKKKTGSSGSEGGSSKTTFTLVETDLARPTEESLVLAVKEPGESVGETDFSGYPVESTVVADRFIVLGDGAEHLARQVLTGPVRDALSALDTNGHLTIGDPTETLLAGMPDMSGSTIGGFLGGKIEEKVREKTSGDPSKVVLETKGAILDADRIERQASAVAAVGNSYEAGSGQGAWTRGTGTQRA